MAEPRAIVKGGDAIILLMHRKQPSASLSRQMLVRVLSGNRWCHPRSGCDRGLVFDKAACGAQVFGAGVQKRSTRPVIAGEAETGSSKMASAGRLPFD